MKFSVIIPTFNRAGILRRTLNLLAVQTFTDFEVVVVDDGSTDETPRLLREFQKKVKYPLRFLSQKNRGSGAARNRGIEKARGELLLFLGDDTLPIPNLLEIHNEFHERHPEPNYACLGRVAWDEEIKITRFMRWLERSGVQFRFHDLRAGSKVDFWRFYTANLSLKREFLGNERFDEDFRGWGFEDSELGLRLQKKGMKLIFTPTARVRHHHHISAKDLKKRSFASGRNAFLFQKKHPEIQILPRGGKLLLQKVAANLLPFTFYGRAKKAFLKGIAEARRETLK